ncbi:MAG: LuxR C-terminal-related transcriptional regulator, partial [Candidatus Dormibacteria bacterium]
SGDALLKSSASPEARLLVFDDLHAADRSSLEVLAHLSGQLQTSSLLVVATYRDTGDDMTEALERLIAQVSRQETTIRLPLSGFDVETVHDQLVGVLQHHVDMELATSVQMRTGGNPFFTAEIARLLQQDPSQGPAGSMVPPRVRDVIATRLNKLPADTRDVLEAAAVIGQEVPTDVLAAACGKSVTWILGALEAAERAGLIRRSGSSRHLQFVHSLVAETTVGALSLSRGASLHTRIARAIEAMRSMTLDDWLPTLARHWAAAEPSAESARHTVEIARLAAEQGESRLAFADAVPLWRMALDASEMGQADARERAELRLGLARSLFRVGDIPGALDAATRAARDAESAGHAELVADAALILEGVSEPQWAAAELGLAERALRRLGTRSLPVRSRLHAQIGQVLYLRTGDVSQRAREEIERGVQLAERSNDPHALQAALRAQQLARGTPSGVDDRLRAAERMTELGRESADPWPELWGRLWSVDALIQLGRLDDAEVELQRLEPIVVTLRWPVARWHLLRERAGLLQARGRFDEALRVAGEALSQLSGSGLERAERMHVTFVEAIAELVGNVPGEEDRMRRMRKWAANDVGSSLRLILALLRRGEADEARTQYARLPPVDRWNPPPFAVVVPLSWRLVSAIRLSLRDEVAALLLRLEPFARWHVAHGAGAFVTFGSAHLYTGMAAASLNDLDRAVSEIGNAVEDNIRSGAEAMAVVARQELAEVLVRRRSGTDLDRARRHASTVLQNAQRFGMHVYVERASTLLKGQPKRRLRSEELTPRELEVAHLVAAGLTNRQIAVRLGISERTAENHLDHIRTKLGFAARAQIAAWIGSGAAGTEGA